MEAIILQTLGNINGFDPSSLLEFANIEDELVSATAVVVGVEDGVVRAQTRQNIVGVQQCDLGGMGQTASAHHLDVCPTDGQDAGATPRCTTDRRDGLFTTSLDQRMTRQERSEVLCDTNGTDTRATATVRNTEGLVKVQMADIGTNFTRRTEADLSVHVGTVHVDLTTVLVNKITGLLDLRFKHTESARVCDHDCTKLLAVLLTLGLQICHVQVSGPALALDCHNTHTGHSCTGRVGAMGRDGNQTDITLLARLLLEVLANNAETGELALSTRVGLQRDRVEASDFCKVGFKLVDQSFVSLGLLRRSKGVDV